MLTTSHKLAWSRLYFVDAHWRHDVWRGEVPFKKSRLQIVANCCKLLQKVAKSCKCQKYIINVKNNLDRKL